MQRSAALILALLIACSATFAPAAAREITDDTGRSVEIPDRPARIVALHDIDLTIPLIELGVFPVGSHGRMGLDGHPYIRSGALLTGVDFDNSDIAYVGSVDIDMEAVAAARPDLIVTTVTRSAPVETLQSIAPTLVFNPAQFGAPHVYRQLAAITDSETRLAYLENRYANAIEQLKKMAHPETITVTVMQPNRGKIDLYHTYRALGQVLRDAGFRFPPIIDAIEDGGRIQVGIEYLPDLDADYIFNPFRSDQGEGAEADVDAMEAIMPNFCSFLSACREGRYIMVAREEAISNSYAALTLMISMIQSHVVKGPQPHD